MMTDDLISRKSVLDWLSPYLHIGERVDPEALVEDIRQIKAVDAVPAVRCKNCKKYRIKTRPNFGWCDKFGNVTRDEDFCSDGEVRQ